MHEKAIEHLSQADKILGRLIKKVGPCNLGAEDEQSNLRHGPFAALVKAVVHQQLNGKAASAILKRVLALYPKRSFPTPADLLRTSEEELRAAGLSRSKVAAIRDIAAHTVSGLVPTAKAIAAMADHEILEKLTAIRGVGPWTVEMLLIFKLRRPDVLPATDYGVRKGFALIYRWKELPTPAELLAYGDTWRPYRSIAAWYLWRSLDLPEEKLLRRP